MLSACVGQDNDLARSVQEACQPKNDGFTQALAGSSKEAIEQALELQLAALQEGARIDSVSPKELHLLRDFLCQAPTGKSCTSFVNVTAG